MRWCLGIVIVVACGGEKRGNPIDPPRDDAAPMRDGAVTDALIDAVIDATPIDAAVTMTTVGAAGGTVTSPDGVVIVIPAGALTTDTTITITEVTANVPSGIFSRLFELGPAGTQFAEPIEVTVPYDPGLLGATPPHETALVWRDTPGDGWRSTGYALVDTGSQTVTGFATHFSQWAIIPTPAENGCQLDYGCFTSCCGVAPPDLCCSVGRSTCRCRGTRTFRGYVACYARCVGTPTTSNFANSKCMNTCCTTNGGTAPRVGVCYTNTKQKAQAILDCGRTCGGMGADEHSLCGSGPITFDACTWNASMSPGIGANCPGAGGGLNSQHLHTDLAAVATQNWGIGSPMQVTGGTVTSSTISATLTCDGGAQTGSFSASRNGGGYIGTWSFDGDTGNITIGPAW